MLKVALDLDLYNILVKAEKAMTTEDIASETKTDPALAKRILRNLAALDHINEVDDDLFSANKFSKAFTTPKGVGGAGFS